MEFSKYILSTAVLAIVGYGLLPGPMSIARAGGISGANATNRCGIVNSCPATAGGSTCSSGSYLGCRSNQSTPGTCTFDLAQKNCGSGDCLQLGGTFTECSD